MEKKETKENGGTSSEPKTKFVRNRSGYRVELVINGEVVVFLPGKEVRVPRDFEVPNGLGLYIR